MDVDERFSNVRKNPRFKKISKKEKQIKIDARFEHMFTDKSFHTKFEKDKRGKLIIEEEVEDLTKFYEIDEDQMSNSEVDQHGSNDSKRQKAVKKRPKLLANVSSKNKILRSTRMQRRKKNLYRNITIDDREEKGAIDFDDIRGQTLPENYSSESSEDSGDDQDADQSDSSEIIHGWGDVDENVKCIENAETSRLACCNCDWDRIGADDLYILFNSFKPPNGTVKCVKIYPSEFGTKRIAEEKLKGPKELVDKPGCVRDEDEDDDFDDSGFNMEKLREYQMKRLKYYYAVIECDTVETANALYEELDGQEYEMSSTRLDLRFIPENVTFEIEPKSSATAETILKNYDPVKFHNTALQQSTVRLTWDEEDPQRIQTTMKKFDEAEIENMDFKDYLASSSEEECDENAEGDGYKDTSCDKDAKDLKMNRCELYKKLIEEIDSKEKTGGADMHVSFGESSKDDTDKIANFTEIALKNKSKYDQSSDEEAGSLSEDGSHSEDDADSNVDGSKVDGDDESIVQTECENNDKGFDDPFFKDNALKKKKAKKTKKKLSASENMNEEEKKGANELELLLLEDEGNQHFNLKQILDQEKRGKNKGKRRRENVEIDTTDTFKMDVTDNRFDALYSSHLYSLDPSSSNFKKTKATQAIIDESQKRRKETELSRNTSLPDEKQNTKISGLVHSVKSKTALHKWNKEKKERKGNVK